MTTRLHDGMFEFLSGQLDAATVATWPDWARRHARACRTCRDILRAEEFASAGSRPTPPAPDFTALVASHLAARRPVPDPGVLLAVGTAPRPARRYRSSASSALELLRTPAGVRAVDPDATEILLFTVASGETPVVLAERHVAAPGLGLEASVASSTLISVVALASREKLNTALWQLWLSDVFRRDAPTVLPLGSAADRVHGAVIQIRPAVAPELIRIQPESMPEPTPAVAAMLKEAAAAGRLARLDEASRHYRRAHDAALGCGDSAGEVRAGIGLAQAMHGLGHEEDADNVLGDVVLRNTFDPRWADFACRAKSWAAIACCDVAEAEAWLDRAVACNPVDSGWRAPLRFQLAFLRGDFREALRHLDPLPDNVTPLFRSIVARERAATLAGCGDLHAARAALASVTERDDSLEALLWRVLAGVMAGAIDDPVSQLAGHLSAHPDQRFSAFDIPPLRGLIRAQRSSGDEVGAARLLRLRFLSPADALGDCPALVASAEPDGILVSDGGITLRLRHLAVSREEFRRLVLAAREEALAGTNPTSGPALRALLFPSGTSREDLRVASDGVLADAPLSVLLAGTHGVPPIVEVVPWPARPPGQLRSEVASIADAWEDLPWAAREVAAQEADVHHRGSAATWAALASLPPVGLLHVGVHARREHGLPFLLMADGVVSPIDLAGARLVDAPVVVLSGCATATQGLSRGVERSFAEGFLRAGARAVIATRWPVEDREMYDLVRGLMAQWPFDSATAVVARVSTRLRSLGAPMRVWASLVVYEPQWR